MFIYPCQAERLIDRSGSLLDYYIDRLYQSESLLDVFSASHWYVNATRSLLTERHSLSSATQRIDSDLQPALISNGSDLKRL